MKTEVLCIVVSFLFWQTVAQTPTLAGLRSLVQSLPAAAAYYPLAAKFGLLDGSGSGLDAYYSQNMVAFVAGPSNTSDTAYQMGAAVTDQTYINFTSGNFAFGTNSWTMAIFVNMNNSIGPILDYADGNLAANLWHSPSTGTLLFDTVRAGVTSMSCSLSSWQFVAWQYDSTQNQVQLYCDTTFGTPMQSMVAPYTTTTFLAGYRNYPVAGLTAATDAQFACLAVYSTALDATQLSQVRQLCQLYDQVLSCDNCVTGTCRPDLSQTHGYVCSSCLAGWGGNDCSSFICNPTCANSGTCIGPNQCRCTSGWTGSACTVHAGASCTPICSKGYQCVGANSCAPNLAGTLCSVPQPDQSSQCPSWQASGQCLLDPASLWSMCPLSCQKYATCNCDVPLGNSVDADCTCGDLASMGQCENDASVNASCLYTCGRRLDPDNFCSSAPQGVALPANAGWNLSPGPPSYFNGASAYLQSARISCNPGYKPDSATKMGLYICDPFTPNAATGNWFAINSNKPTCLLVECPLPPAIEGAYYVNYTTNSNFFYGDRVTYYCNPGLLISEAIVPDALCTLTGTGWSFADKKPQCTPPPCQAPVQAVNGFYNISANYPGGFATYSCIDGYAPNNSISLFLKTCQNDGSWAPAGTPICTVVVCNPPDNEPHSYISNPKKKYIYGDSVNVYCSKGAQSMYIQPGTESTPLEVVTKTCLDTGSWSSDTLNCLLVSCPSPASFEIATYRMNNASIDHSTILYGTVIAFECDYTQGYEVDGNHSSNSMAYWRCNENSTWDTQPLKCAQSGILKSLNSKSTAQTYVSEDAVAMASVVLMILSFFLGVIVCMDYLTMQRDMKRLRHNLNNFFRRFRDSNRAKELHHVRTVARLKILKKDFIQRKEAQRDIKMLHATGLSKNSAAADDDGDLLVPNPLTRDARNSERPLSAENLGHSRDRVEGPMDIPESVELRFGLSPHEDHTIIKV